MPKISVIIPMYNTEKFVGQAIKSALAQTYTDYEIIVVNDGSTDDSRTIAEQYTDKITIVDQANQGLAAARNTGIRSSKGEYIALLDADDMWHTDKLSEQVKVLDEDPKAAIVHCGAVFVSEENETLEKKSWGSTLNAQYGNIYKELYLRKLSITASSAMFRKDAALKAGLFDEHLSRLGCEDRDLWIRMAKDHAVAYVNKGLVHFRITKGSMEKNSHKMIEASEYIIEKYFQLGWFDSKIRKQALAHVYRQWGDSELLGGHFSQARKLFMKSILNKPCDGWAYLNLIKAVFNITSLKNQKTLELAK